MLGNTTLCNATQHALLLYVKMIETLIMCSSKEIKDVSGIDMLIASECNVHGVFRR